MSFLDNLEDNLKALESREQTGLDDRKRREADRKQSAEAAPWADRLKHSAYTEALLRQATRAGYQIRSKVNFSWIGTTLRLEAREQRLELRPSASGVDAVYVRSGEEVKRERIELAGEPDALLTYWLEMIGRQKKLEAEAAAAVPEEE